MIRRAALVALLCALLSSCAPKASIAWNPSPSTVIDLPELVAPIPGSPASQVAPGRVELDEELLGYLLDVEGLYAPARGALALAYRERDAMEVEARSIMRAQELQITEARRGQLRSALVGAGAGAGVVAAVVLAVVLGGR